MFASSNLIEDCVKGNPGSHKSKRNLLSSLNLDLHRIWGGASVNPQSSNTKHSATICWQLNASFEIVLGSTYIDKSSLKHWNSVLTHWVDSCLPISSPACKWLTFLKMIYFPKCKWLTSLKMQMIILSENYKLSQVQMQMINFPESQIQPGSISTFHNFQSNSRSKESEVNHQTCNPPDFIFETSNNKKTWCCFVQIFKFPEKVSP